MIHVKNLSFAYPDGNRALTDVSIDIEKGAAVAVVGANGAGKSTLLALLVGVLVPEEGEIEIAGFPVKKDRLEDIRRKTGFV
ncbi:MAG: ATP-binding cassette domain-containing protein, partial [Eubacteriales bacterium]|nr:ATP-binding cassette domain-containing protein [Eubacteriales bacterium]